MVSKSTTSHALLIAQVQKNLHYYCKTFNIKNEANYKMIALTMDSTVKHRVAFKEVPDS